MKGKSLLTFVLLVAGFLAAGFPSFAQDVITKKDGTDIQAKVLEVNENEVKYRRYDYLDGPIFTMLKSDILIIRYENGTNDVFNGKGKSVTTVKSEPQPTVTDTEDRDRDDVKKDKKDSKKKSKKESSKKESKKDLKKEKKASKDDEEVVDVDEEVKKDVKKEEEKVKEKKKDKDKKESKKESSKKESKKDLKKEKKASKVDEEVVDEEKEEVKKDVKKDSKKEKDSSKKDKDKGGNKSVDGIEILSGDTYFLTKSAEAELVFDYDNTVVEGKPLMEYLNGQGSDWLEDWPENQEFISGKFLEFFNDKSKGMTLVDHEEAPYRLVIHVDEMDFGSVAGNPFNPYSGGAEVSGTVELVDASNGKTRLSMDFTDIQGVRQMSSTWRLEYAFIELAKRLVKYAK